MILFFLGIAKSEIIGDWCGTIPVLKDFRENKILQRPTLSGPVEYIERTDFRIHFTRQGSDAVSLAYAESVASHTQYSWSKQIDSLGWIEPPPDYGLGGDDRYDIYLKALPSGIAGMAIPEYYYSNPYPDGATSHIQISNSLGIGGFLRIVCAHEFNHAVQFRYSAEEDIFWYENTSTWMEDVCYENVNSYIGYLSSSPNPLGNPEYPINTFYNLYQYAGGIWPMFLDEYYNIDCVRQIWDYQGTIAGENTLPAFDYILTNYYSSNLTTALKKYALWRYFTGSRADTTRYFKEGNLWPLVRPLRTHSSYPASGNQSSYYPSGPGGCNYIQFQNGGGKLFLNFDGQDGYDWTCLVIGYRTNLPSLEYEFQLNPQAQGSDSFLWQDKDHFVLIPVVSEWYAGYLSFNYSAQIRVVYDVGVERLTGFSILMDSGEVVIPEALIKNYGLYQETFPVRLLVGDFYSNTQYLTLNPQDSSLVTFAPCTLRGRGYSNFRCTTLLAQDERNSNDYETGRVFIRVRDVAAIGIIEPQGNIGQGSYIRPKVRLKNFGNLAENFDVGLFIGNWQTTKRIRLSAMSELEMVFDSTWYAADTGNFLVKCTTKLSADKNPNNDKVISNFYVYPIAISEKIVSFISTIKIPSIIFDRKITITGFSEVNTLELFDIKGGRVYYEKPAKPSFYLRNLASGSYILRLKVNDRFLIYKTIVIR